MLVHGAGLEVAQLRLDESAEVPGRLVQDVCARCSSPLWMMIMPTRIWVAGIIMGVSPHPRKRRRNLAEPRPPVHRAPRPPGEGRGAPDSRSGPLWFRRPALGSVAGSPFGARGRDADHSKRARAPGASVPTGGLDVASAAAATSRCEYPPVRVRPDRGLRLADVRVKRTWLPGRTRDLEVELLVQGIRTISSAIIACPTSMGWIAVRRKDASGGEGRRERQPADVVAVARRSRCRARGHPPGSPGVRRPSTRSLR